MMLFLRREACYEVVLWLLFDIIIIRIFDDSCLFFVLLVI